MKSRDSGTTPRLRRLFAGSLAAGLLAGLILMDTGLAAAQDEEEVDYSKTSVGGVLYREWCRSCHGEKGKGDGPVAEHLRVAPGDLTLLRQREGGQFSFGRVTAKIDGREKVRGHGSKDMPVWGAAFQVVDETGGEEAAQEKILALVHFLRSIQVTAEESSP